MHKENSCFLMAPTQSH